MKIIIYRGTRQIGGVATEICTQTTRIIIDMGEELGLEENFLPAPLNISGVTNADGICDAVLVTHYHGDHTGQLKNVREDIPLYMGELTKEVLLLSLQNEMETFKNRISAANVFEQGKTFFIGDIRITPYCIDHSAYDSYMFLIEAESKRILFTGDFRLHGFRGKAIPKILSSLVKKVDVLITEGTTLSRSQKSVMTEWELIEKAKKYFVDHKYVYVLCASTNLERICAFSRATPRGKYFICDKYQYALLNAFEKSAGKYSNWFCGIKKTTYGKNILGKLKRYGFVMLVRDNNFFRQLIQNFDRDKSIMLYSMWDGYRSKPGSRIPQFLELSESWASLHTSGHAGIDGISLFVEKTSPSHIVPMHTDSPDVLKKVWPNKVVLLTDGEEWIVP